MDFEESVRRTISRERLIDSGDRILVGVSGGLDSSTLLYCLHRLKDTLSIELGVAHVNHQLRGAESERDEAFVRNLAERFSLPFHLHKADVKNIGRKAGMSVQHAGRDVRYAFFSRLAQSEGYGKIAIAHNKDDQVETFLLRVVKGTGLNGLSSIPIKRGPIIRPFLSVYRSEIAAYAASQGIVHVEDSSNLKDTYERNFLRHRVAPLLEQINPRFREKVLLLLADITALDADFDRDAEDFLVHHASGNGVEFRVSLGALKDLHGETRFRVVSRLLARLEPGFIALREHFGLVEKSLSSVRPNTAAILPHNIRVVRVYDEALFTKKPAVKPILEVFKVQAGANAFPPLGVEFDVSLHEKKPEGFGEDRTSVILDADLTGPLTVRTFRNGDRFIPLGMKDQIKLKDYFISKKIPREQRRQIPLLLSGGDIAWVVGERIDERFKVTPGTVRFLRITARFQTTD